MRERGPLVLLLDSLPERVACDSSLPGIAQLVNRSSGAVTCLGKPNSVRVPAGKTRRAVDWVRECEKQTRRYGVVSIDAGEAPEGVAHMLRLVDQGLYEHDEGSDNPYSGANSFNLLDYGWLADTCGLRACAVDCSKLDNRG